MIKSVSHSLPIPQVCYSFHGPQGGRVARIQTPSVCLEMLLLLLLLLLLSRFSCVRLCATPYTAAHQAPPSLEFSRQEHWSGLPFPSPMHENEKWKWSRSSSPTLCDPMDYSLPGSPVHGIFQARVLEWGPIAFSIRNASNYLLFKKNRISQNL